MTKLEAAGVNETAIATKLSRDLTCPSCASPPGRACTMFGPDASRSAPHLARIQAALERYVHADADGWRPIESAPRNATWFEGREVATGRVVRAHYATGDGDGMMPPFDGFFERRGVGDRNDYFIGVRLEAWREERVNHEATDNGGAGAATGERAPGAPISA